MAVKGRMAYFSECKVEQEPLGKKKDQRFRVRETAFLLFLLRLLHRFICEITRLPYRNIYHDNDWRVTSKIKEKNLNPRLEVRT